MEQLTQFVNKSFEKCETAASAMRLASLGSEPSDVDSDVKPEQTCLDLFKINLAVKAERRSAEERLQLHYHGVDVGIRGEGNVGADDDIDDEDDDEDDEIDIDNVPEEEDEEERRLREKVENFPGESKLFALHKVAVLHPFLSLCLSLLLPLLPLSFSLSLSLSPLLSLQFPAVTSFSLYLFIYIFFQTSSSLSLSPSLSLSLSVSPILLHNTYGDEISI